jgi:hypothetical protein
MATVDEVFPPAAPAEPAFVAKLRAELGLERCNIPPFIHQVIGVKKLITDPYVFLADEPGAAKTAQVIISACLMFLAGKIDRVVVVAPADVRPVWFDRELGELATHLWPSIPARISEYHSRIRQWDSGDWSKSDKQLRWIITNYQFIRDKSRLATLASYCNRRTLLALDESSLVRNRLSAQSRACATLRKRCGRVVLMNGTPFGESPLDLLNQGNLLSKTILDCTSKAVFRHRYAIMRTDCDYPQVKEWVNLEDLQRRFAPHVLRRLKKDCIDLPQALPPQLREVRLTPTTWAHYKAMRDDMVTMLRTNVGSLASQAMVKALRLSQITGGFVGGVETMVNPDELDFGERPAWLGDPDPVPLVSRDTRPVNPVAEIGTEKLDWTIEFLKDHLEQDPNFKLLIWCRFRAEMWRVVESVRKLGTVPYDHVGYLVGQQRKTERELMLRLLHPRTAPEGPVVVVATYGTGSMGHNFSACHTVVNHSFDQSLLKAQQAEARVDRPGQVNQVSYYDVIATGPNGQKTIDHAIVKAKRAKADLAAWTTGAWIRALEEE